MSYRRSSRSDILWPSESRLDPEKVDLKFEVPWSNRRLSEFGGFLSGLSGKSSMYLTRMVVSKEAGLEFHYKETLNGLDEVVHLELGQVSAVHHWTRKFRNPDGPDTTEDFFAIISDSVVHKLPKLEEPQPWEPDWDADVPEKIRKLCDILELSLNKTKPWEPDFLERSKKENTGAKRVDFVRIVNVFVATLLFLFGLTFTLMPYFVYRTEDMSDDPFILLFLAATLPFSIFGLFVLSIARGMITGEWTVAGAHETNSDLRWWNGNQDPTSKNNWIGPDGVESGPDAPEDWYLTYDGPAPAVEDINDENYVVDRGNGAVPIEFYINKWGVPEGFGEMDNERPYWMPKSSRAEADEGPDKDFISEPDPLTHVIGGSLVLGALVVVFLGGIPFLIMDVGFPILPSVFCGIPSLLLGALFCVALFDRIRRLRLRVQHSKDRLVHQELVLGIPVLFTSERLSEALYLETDKNGKYYVIHGRSSEGKEWEISIRALISTFDNSRYMARQIANAIGIEFRIE